MGNEFRYLWLVETRRLLLLMGVVFGMFLFVQYFELPYIHNVFSSLFEANKSQVTSMENFHSRNSSMNPTASSNPTQFSSINSTDLNGDNGVSSTTVASERMGGDVTNLEDDFDLENKRTLNDTLNENIDPDYESPFKDFVGMDYNSSIDDWAVRNNSFSRDTGDEFPVSEVTSNSSISLNHDGIGDVPTSERNEDKISETPSVSISPPKNFSHYLSPQNPETSFTSTETSPPIGKDTESILQNNENPEVPKADHSTPVTEPSIRSTKGVKGLESAVIPISKMNDMLLLSRVSYKTVKMRWSSPVDEELLKAKSLIEEAPIIEDDPQFDVSLYRNFSAFKSSLSF